ncbi:MAG: hypothetical protein K6E12_07515 [Saccharofermentans sp.]|nr:hypothetical protein [Saccharofermentans sp.]
MKHSKSKSTVTIAIIGSIVFLLVLLVGTILTGLMATRDTEKAVEYVSLLYLDELAGRREQVVSANLNKKIEDMNVALELMTGEDLSDI